MQVQDPSGETWTVKRRWLPWRPRLREGALDAGVQAIDLADGPLIVVVLGVALIPVGVVLAVFVAETAAVLIVLAVLTLARSAFIGRWPIAVRRDRAVVHLESVRGWGDSRRRMLDLVDGIRLGEGPRSARRHRRDGGAV